MTDADQAFDASKWPAYLTVPEVAAVMRVSKMTVYRLVHKGELVSARVGRSFRIDSASLDAYLKGGEVPVP
jgi:excisionase family DNA binding protein